MNKKIIITIATITVLAVGSLIGYNVYQNSKQELPQKTVEITSTDKIIEDDKEKASSAEEKKDVETVLDAEQAQIVFKRLHDAITDIDFNVAEQVKKQEEVIKETTHPALTDVTLKRNVEGKQNPYKAEKTSFNLKEIEEVQYRLKDKFYKGFKLKYDYVVEDNGKKINMSNKTAIVVLDEDNKYKVMQFDVVEK